MKTSWKKELQEVCKNHGDDFDSLTISIEDGELEREFDSSYGGIEGAAFTAWSKDYVYFPLCYDGSEWVGFAPRNPCPRKMGHQGGG